MTDRYDPIPDLATLIWAAVYEDRSATRRAEAILPRLGIGGNDSAGVRAIEAGLREELTPALTEGQCFQVREARDILGTWDLNNPGGVSRETVLADQVRALLAIIDEKGLAGDA
jgi:hypothetical protein